MKLIARIFLPFFLVWCVTIPRTAYAIVPQAVAAYLLPDVSAISLAAPGAAGGSTAAAVLAATDAFGVAIASLGIGVLVGYNAVDYLVGGVNYTVRIPLTSDPAKAVPAPSAPATAAQSPAGTLYVASFTSAQCPSGFNYSSTDPTVLATQYVAAANASSTCSPSTYKYEVAPTDARLVRWCYVNSPTACGSPIAPWTSTSTQPASCPSGYVVSGSGCVLSDARAATPDKACDLQRSGSALAMISDPDCTASGSAIPVICSAAGTSCVGYGTSANGQPRSFVIVPNADGGSTISYFQQRPLNGQTVVDSTNIVVAANGTVASVAASTAVGSIPNPATSTAAIGTPATVSPVTSTPVAPSSGSTVPPPAIPSDYARQGEAAAAAQPLAKETTMVQVRDAITASGETADVATPNITASNTLKSDYARGGQDVTDRSTGLGLPTLPAWLFPDFRPAACVNPAVDTPAAVTGNSYRITWDICPYVPIIKKIEAWILYLITAALCFSMIMNFRAMRLKG